MAKSSKIEPVNIELYEKAWAHSGHGVQVVKKSPVRPRIKKQTSRKKKKKVRRQKNKQRSERY